MIKHFDYQERAIDEITAKTVKLLNEGGTRRKLIFEAPTGAGKTIMMCRALARIAETLKSDGTTRCEDAAYIWIAPRKLHIQSYLKLKDAFAEGRELRPVMFDELEQSEGIQPGEILFVNWESINKDTNLMVRESEASASIFDICQRTQEEFGLPLVAVIDEEHEYWTKTADKTKLVLDRLNPAVEIRVSATPKTTRYDEKVRIARKDVIEAEMIKKEVVLNPGMDNMAREENVLNYALLRAATQKRAQLAQAYKDAGSRLNPLLLIQLPNDKKESMTEEDTAIAETVREYLQTMETITVENGRLAVWLSNRKENVDDIENPRSPVDVLLFKEAIAHGWDCPRAAVLLIFRKLQSNEFTIQTVGRILRMPEQHHYTDDRLNIGYVFTDIAKEKIQIVTTDADYIKKNALCAVRRPELTNVALKSYYTERTSESRNRLGPDFRKVLREVSEKFWDAAQATGSLFTLDELAAMRGDDAPQPLPDTEDEKINENRRKVSNRTENRIRLDVRNINVEIPANIHFQNEVQTIDVQGNEVKFARTASEIDRVFINHVAGYVTSYEQSLNPADKLAGYLLETLEDYFGLYYTDAKKVVLYHENKPVFDRLIKQALERYDKIRDFKRQEAARKALKEYKWSVPEERLYDEDTNHVTKAENHAMLPFVELNKASNPEKDFVDFLQKYEDCIDWWYKNGDSGRQNYAVTYEKPDGTGAPGLFYVDFVIRLKNGKIFLFDTKSAGSEPLTAPLKHNALTDYINDENAKGANLAGGVIVKDGMNWVWSRFGIENTTDHDGWDYFDPRRENA